MSLEECDVELEEGIYGDFKFTLRLLYDKKTNKCVGGVLYLKEKENRIDSVELFIDPKSLLDVTPLQLNAAKCNFDVKDIKGLYAEIGRKLTLVEFLRKPDLFMIIPKYADPMVWLYKYPELAFPEYHNRLPENLKTRIKEYLEKMKVQRSV